METIPLLTLEGTPRFMRGVSDFDIALASYIVNKSNSIGGDLILAASSIGTQCAKEVLESNAGYKTIDSFWDALTLTQIGQKDYANAPFFTYAMECMAACQYSNILTYLSYCYATLRTYYAAFPADWNSLTWTYGDESWTSNVKIADWQDMKKKLIVLDTGDDGMMCFAPLNELGISRMAGLVQLLLGSLGKNDFGNYRAWLNNQTDDGLYERVSNAVDVLNRSTAEDVEIAKEAGLEAVKQFDNYIPWKRILIIGGVAVLLYDYLSRGITYNVAKRLTNK
jgi:hypothetical protein